MKKIILFITSILLAILVIYISYVSFLMKNKDTRSEFNTIKASLIIAISSNKLMDMEKVDENIDCSKIFSDDKCISLKISESELNEIGLEKLKDFIKNPCSIYQDERITKRLNSSPEGYKEIKHNFINNCSSITQTFPVVVSVYQSEKLINQLTFK